ncbi:MazG nucleotide pyrophosphohydrolase domain-containing protein [Psychromicrobium xiongbiense]|uniref:MazG nucleotide pyrophosphohydrolase domain-containing protein n=1 Tax=Psychromicrobium xiongbiense TaxID=3051184 RepID=UPI00255441E2|nr:MazG nucleotide pyrophosphohydrolase domain-containing protein [Psychromicrobium sp. YIM S02556]
MSAGADFDRLVEVVGALREHCPWMGALTHESLLSYLIEESYEVLDAVETGAPAPELASELGDVLLQVVLHARLAQESGDFTVSEVVRGLSEKMIRRNPHVFHPDGTLQAEFPATVEEIVTRWDAVKAEESPSRGRFEGIPATLPALAAAQKTLRRAGIGRESEREAEPLAGELLTEEQLGERIFALLRAAPGVDAERALRAATRRFQTGFED